jgi:aromatic ring-opening dioxygenase catalytic subunit (LigB family)
MAVIVMAGAMSHLPAATGWPEQARPAEVSNFRRAAAELGAEVRRSRPDVIVGVANDHVMNFDFGEPSVFAVNLGDRHSGPGDWFEPWLRVPRYAVPGHPRVAAQIFECAAEQGMPIRAVRENFVYDDNYSVPLTLTGLATAGIPLVPIMMNCTVPPIIPSRDAYRWGQVLGGVIRERLPAHIRVALLATGGLSHEPGGPRYLSIDRQFDRWFLGLLERGSHADVIGQVTVERMEEAGSGGTTELLAWMVVMGAIGERRCQVLAYESPESWRCGAGVVRWEVSDGEPAGAAAGQEGTVTGSEDETP